MDPQTCTAILLKQTNPFYISDNNEDVTITLLKSSFGHVHKETNLESCLNYIKLLPSSSTLLLIEIDESTEMISEIIDKISKNIPVVVCSTNDDSQFMLDCIQAGATDYILKPIRPDVIKTLFLSLYRQQQQQNQIIESPLYEDHLISSSTISTVTSVTSPITPTVIPPHPHQHTSVYLPDRIQDRIRELNNKDINFTKAIIDTYIPTTPPLLPTYKPLNSEYREILNKKVSAWDFSPLDLSHDQLVHCAVLIISQVFTLPEVTIIPQEQLYHFILDLSSVYHNENPYHNFAHAVDVLQCIYYSLCQLGLLSLADGSSNLSNQRVYQILRPKDIFALFIAAIGHDTAHPGVNNTFLINTSAPLALLYNDSSVLESFHAMALFQLLKKHKLDEIIGGTNSKDYQEFRKLVITSILATDMALHNDYVTKIKEQKKRLRESDPSDWDAAKTLEERLLLCSGLIKCADISNVARPFPRAYEWAQILIEEFASQGDLERELGMNVLPMNDRGLIILEDSQIGFIRFVALELFEIMGTHLQELSFPVDHIKRNLSIWEDRKRKNIEKNHDHAMEEELLLENQSSSSSSTTATEDFQTQAVNALNTKDTSYTIPKMPAVAMTDLSHTGKTREFDHEWEESSGPVYCQCIIQ